MFFFVFCVLCVCVCVLFICLFIYFFRGWGGVNCFWGRILGIFRPFSVTNERPEISALFPGKRADFSFSPWAEGGGRKADFTKGQCINT